MKRFLLLIVMLAAVTTLAACGSAAKESISAVAPQDTDDTTLAPVMEAGTEDLQETEEDVEGKTFDIQAGGLTLRYPKKWENKVTVAADDRKVSFSCGDARLFDILFNAEEGTVQATVMNDGESVVISTVEYPIVGGTEDLYDMAADMNTIFVHLEKDYGFFTGEPEKTEEPSENDTFRIDTAYMTLQYPARWQEIVTVDVQQDRVSFSDNGTPLFDLVFSECDGYLFGSYAGTPVYMVDYPVQNDEQAAMQEDVNVILQHLMADPDFTVNA